MYLCNQQWRAQRIALQTQAHHIQQRAQQLFVVALEEARPYSNSPHLHFQFSSCMCIRTYYETHDCYYHHIHHHEWETQFN
uniref:Uncharacterized protein n=1 Tax=Glossina brevipalpis TaxID=37001 RepID=A0A1A9X000_9MUSC